MMKTMIYDKNYDININTHITLKLKQKFEYENYASNTTDCV